VACFTAALLALPAWRLRPREAIASSVPGEVAKT
jgi:hypothetical protein